MSTENQINDERFRDDVILIVGAAGGIGESTCRLFAASGARVVATDADERIHAVATTTGVVSAGGSHHLIDITDPISIESVVSTTIGRYGRIDHLVVLAGVLHEASPVESFDPAEWQRVLDTNLTGPFLAARAVVPHMRAQKKGSIVNIASWWGHSGHAFFSAYCASKAGVIMLTQSLADELAGDGIRANTICPGNINTSMHISALETEAAKRSLSFEEMKANEWAKIPLGGAGDPSVIADGVAFLCSDAASYITGTSLDINGGVLFR